MAVLVPMAILRPSAQADDQGNRVKTEAGAAKLQFGPVMERVVGFDVRSKTAYLDLDKGDYVDPGTNAIVHGMKESPPGVDLKATTYENDTRARMGINLVAIPVDNKQWDAAPEAVLADVSGAKPQEQVRLGADDHTKTYFIKTSEGNAGVLQLTPRKDSDLVEVRWRFAQAGLGRAAVLANTNQGPFVAFGRVTDEQGRPMEGVEVRANCGIGTLFPTGRTNSDSNGVYRVAFGPGFLMNRDDTHPFGVGFQVATISATTPGYFDQNLGRQGNLAMTDRATVGDEAKRFSGLVKPHEPYHLDFVLAPSATVTGWLVDEQERPIAGQRLYLSGEELPPSQSVLASSNTDSEGRFQFDQVPTSHSWWLSLTDSQTGQEVVTQSMTFPVAGEHQVKLRCSREAGTGKNALGLTTVGPQSVGRHWARLVVGHDQLTFEGQETTWEQLPDLLDQVPNRKATTLALAAASNEVWSNDQLHVVMGRGAELARQHGFGDYVGYLGKYPLGSKGAPSFVLPVNVYGPRSATKSTQFRQSSGKEPRDEVAAVAPVARRLPQAANTADLWEQIAQRKDNELRAKALAQLGAERDGPPVEGAQGPSAAPVRSPPAEGKPTAAVGVVLTVAKDGGGQFTSIQAAIDAAPAGADVRVGPGIYEENVLLTKLWDSLIAAVWGNGIVLGERDRPPSSARIRNCDIRNCHHVGIWIYYRNDDVRVEGCRVSGAAWHGIRYGSSPQIVGNLIFGNARSGIYAEGKTAATVRGNVFFRNEMDAISCWYENRDRIEENTFVDNLREGIRVLGASAPLIRNNIFVGHPQAILAGQINAKGPTAQAVGEPRLEHNLFWNNQTNWIRRLPTAAGASPQVEVMELGELTRSLIADPRLVNPGAQDFALAADSPARRLQVGVADPKPIASPWPLQPEEKAMIPEGDTRDSQQWKAPDASAAARLRSSAAAVP